MSHKIQVRRGLQSDLPLLDEGEIGFALDEKRTYIGSPSGNVELAKASELAETDTQVALQKYYVSAKEFGAKGDGVTDDTAAIQAAITSANDVKLEPGIYRVTDTIRVGARGKSLIGLTTNMRDYGSKVIIRYDGPLDNRKPVVLLGTNLVGAEPATDCTANVLKGIIVDANNRAGFGVYGTYLTNETLVERVTATNALEYNMYFARAWYATLRDLLSIGGKNNGLAFGMPLEYLDGTAPTWTTPAPLEMNSCLIHNIRAISSGKHFSEDNPGTFNPTNSVMRRRGYGIGAGIGNSFVMDTFTSEKSGGAGLYVYTDFQPLKTIRKGYLENNCYNSGLIVDSTLGNIILENINATGGPIMIEDIFANYESGGIYHTGILGRKIWLKNIQQPRFLKSLDGLTALQLYAEVLKDRVYLGCGTYNTFEELTEGPMAYQTVNSRYSFTINLLPKKTFYMIYMKSDVTAPWGTYVVNYEDGTNEAFAFPTTLTTAFQLIRVVSGVSKGGIVSITKSGATGAEDRNVTFKIVGTKPTYF